MSSTKENNYKYVKASIERRRQWIDSQKTKPCERCGGEFPPYVMDWHHRDPSTKKFGIGKGAYRHSRQDLVDEIAKCDLYCANCHRIMEHEKRLNSSVGRAVLS